MLDTLCSESLIKVTLDTVVAQQCTVLWLPILLLVARAAAANQKSICDRYKKLRRELHTVTIGYRVDTESVVLGEGRGFEIAQGRLGPGRLHHCMRVCGMGELALRLVAARVLERKTFGATLARSSLVQAQLAEAWLKLHCAWCGTCSSVACPLSVVSQAPCHSGGES